MSRYQIGVLAVVAALVVGAIWWRTAGPANGQIVDVKVPALSGQQAEGEVLFNSNCATCHGSNAAGSDKGPPLIHKYYEPGHHSDGAFYFAVAHGVQQHHWNFGDMQPVKGVDEPAVTKIIAYVRALQRHNGIH